MHEYKCMLEQKKAHKHTNNDVFFMLPSSRGGNRWTDTMRQTSRPWEHIVPWKPARFTQAAAEI